MSSTGSTYVLLIIESVYQGAGQTATNPMPPTQWGYDKNLKDAPYDVDKAKALLKEAGYPDGFDLTLWAMPVQRPYNPNARLMAEMLQSDWAKIGVKVEYRHLRVGRIHPPRPCR